MDGRTPMVVTEDMILAMEPNSVIIDISIDSGGCFETSELTTHDAPTFEKFGVIHYMVPNMASAVGHTATIAMSNIVGPLLQQVADSGGVEDCFALRLECSGRTVYVQGAADQGPFRRAFRPSVLE